MKPLPETAVNGSVPGLRRRTVLRWGFLTGCACLVAGTAWAAPKAPKPLKPNYLIVTTCGMVTDIVREVAGEQATVSGLMGEGVDPHLYKPTRDDVAKLLKADVVFYSGLMLEGRLTDTLLKVARSGTPVFPVTELLDESFLLEPPEFAGHTDPHVWMDVRAWMEAVKVVAKSLGEVDPPHAGEYRQRSEAYLTRLQGLQDYVKKSLATVPTERRVLITAHDAFNYFGRAYGLEVRGIQGISTESEAGVADVNRLVDLLVARKIPAIFVESSVSDKNIRALIEGCKARGHAVRIGGELFSDAMGKPGSYEGTYAGMLDHNATVITRALGGTAPVGGWQGKLAPETSR